jgi:hypothetical protein
MREWRYSSTILDVGRFTTGERAHAAHCIGGWVGTRACQERREKSLALAGNQTPTVQPVVRRYTD